MGEVFLSAVRTRPSSMASEPFLQAGLTEVLPTTLSEVGVAENLGTDGRTQKLFGHFFKEIVFVSTIRMVLHEAIHREYRYQTLEHRQGKSLRVLVLAADNSI